MDEEKEEKKKPGIMKRILKWFGLGLLTVLIILGLIFQAPWKVTTLLLVILAACTVLPKPARKWFWLSVGVVVVALIIWVLLPDDTEGWRPYTFDEELAALEAKYAIPDEENAAIIYNTLLASYDVNDFDPNFADIDFSDLVHSGPWVSEDYPEAAAWLKGHQSTIARLLEAAQMEKCRFPMVADSVKLSETMERLAPMKRWAYLLVCAANNDLGEHRINQALEKQIALLQMAAHLYQQLTMIDFLVGMAIEGLVTKQFNRFVIAGDATEAHLSVIEKAMAEIKHDWASDLPRILEGERLFVKSIFSMAYEINPKGKTRLSRDPTAIIRVQCQEELPPLTYWQRKLMKAATILVWLYVPSTPQKAGEIIDAKYEKFYAMAEAGFDWEKAMEKSSRMLRLNYRYLVEHLVSILEPAYYRVYDIYLRLTVDKRGSRIIIALRRYKNQNGFWPVNLDDVKSMAPAEIFVDPTNGGDFVYEITEENFRLYSKGKNGIDEDGERDEIAGTDDWLIWPPRSRKAKEEGTDAEQQ